MALMGAFNYRELHLAAKNSGKGHVLLSHEIFLNEYAVLFRTLHALMLPCNAARVGICFRFSVWAQQKIRHLHEMCRSRSLNKWERNVQREYLDQRLENQRLNSELNCEKMLRHRIQLNYENLLRKLAKPTNVKM